MNYMYIRQNPRCLSVRLVKEYKVAKTRLLLTLIHSVDEETSDAGIQARA